MRQAPLKEYVVKADKTMYVVKAFSAYAAKKMVRRKYDPMCDHLSVSDFVAGIHGNRADLVIVDEVHTQ